MAKQIFLFIVFLRALAAIIITNSHYNGVYPLEIIANGGLLGDILFFAISGYCLANVTMSFKKWYIRRFFRIYVVVWIITIVYFLLGFYEVNNISDFLFAYIWPTKYHFVGSIIVLYVPFYFLCKNIVLTNKNYIKTALALAVAQLLIYLILYDKSYYHIDVVREPMIWFLFLQSMLLGAFFRRRNVENPQFSYSILLMFLCSIVLYFCSKIAFSKIPSISNFQILNQYIIFIALFYFFYLFSNLELALKGVPIWMHKVANFFADHTLEIYCVQYVLIPNLNIGVFPVNWLIITFSIIVSAYLLRKVSQLIIKKINI